MSLSYCPRCRERVESCVCPPTAPTPTPLSKAEKVLLKAFADEVEKLIDRQEKVNLQLHGRPDCKSYSLSESIQALLEKRGNERSKSF